MKLIFKTSLLLLAFPLWAETIPLSDKSNTPSSVSVNKIEGPGFNVHKINFDLKSVTALSHPIHLQYKVLSEKNISFSQTVGEAQLPFKSVVVVGSPDEIEVTIDGKNSVEVAILSAPAQPEDCRCETKKTKIWVPLKQANNQGLHKVEYLGKFRGQDLSRVTLYAAKSNAEKRTTIFYPQLEAQIKSSRSLSNLYAEEINSEYDLLLVSPETLLPGLVEFVQYKIQSGLRVKIVNLETIGKDVAKLTQFFKTEYKSANYKYALIVGTDDLFPNHQVNTSGSARTPSDYPYFLMDSADMIPDIQYGRVVASSVEEVKRQTVKWMDYQDHTSESSQYLKMIGIASNEGDSPSDDEYVEGIENDLSAAFGTTATHFYENDSTSTPNYINEAFNKGTGLLVYLGHGSGTSWASTGADYTNSSIKQMNNSSVLKPIIIDVACQNGILKTGYFGETFMNAKNSQGESIGASMYYGGSVNISWHPPAIMAKGMVKEAIAQKLDKMGDVLFSGHIYLMENYTDLESVRDNFEWYHLFGDPSAPFHFN